MKIYKVVNSINGKIYIGQSVQPIAARWRQHKAMQGRCRALESAIRKYGADKFSVEEIATAESQTELDTLEQFWIARLNTVSPHGYNLSGGGNGAGKMHDETKEIIRKNAGRPEHLARFEEIRSRPEVRAKMTDGLKARWADVGYKKKTGAAISASLNKPDVKAQRSAAIILAAAKPENKAKLAAAMAKANLRQEVKDNRSAGVSKAWSIPGERERRAAAISAAKNTPEAKARYAATNALPEVKARRSAASTGRIVSAETRLKKSLAQTGKKLGPQDKSYLTPEFKARRGAAIRAGKARAKAARSIEKDLIA